MASTLQCRARCSAVHCFARSHNQLRPTRVIHTPRHVSLYSSFMGSRLFVQEPVCSRTSKASATASRQVTQMSFFGVGAPEAILVAIVSLVVFGPKGLAEAAKSVGQALRTLQPTVKEVVEVSQDLRSTLESELGLNELRDAARANPTPRPLTMDEFAGPRPTPAATPTPGEPSSTAAAGEPVPPTLRAVSDSMAKVVDPEIDSKRAAAAAAAWGTGYAPAPVPQQQAAPPKDLSNLSLEDLEAELQRRRTTPKA